MAGKKSADAPKADRKTKDPAKAPQKCADKLKTSNLTLQRYRRLRLLIANPIPRNISLTVAVECVGRTVIMRPTNPRVFNKPDAKAASVHAATNHSARRFP